ncbi:hypothetical protein DFQ04_3243 [Algoriphagus boseongensis]|uniref:Uncharacterized protein n=1 Tax=Algoriphagus boseongensis TaxID=1442587 RepID=A0A4R6T0S6_9BACT|nr:hypothetical protein [Algoriphagus boseongensis]TDQ14653.1 hypothetical protein DFQ04_3243 [Algoriphagus boseongensis]
MKNTFKQGLSGAVFLMAIWSCTLEEIETPQQSAMLDPIPLAQAFYETEKPKQGNFYGRITSDLEVFPHWEGAKSYSDGRILIVPAHRKVKATYAQGYLRRLVFQVDESGEVIRGGILEIAGKDGDFLLDNEEVLIEGFLSGVKSSQLTYLWSDFGSKPLDGMQANGRTVERSIDRLLNSRKGTEGFSFENCIDWYWVYSIGGVVVYEEYSHTTCGGEGCGTGGLRVTNQNDACLDDGTNGGGGDGGQITYKIENKVQNPCISGQVDKAVDSQFKNQITNLINNAFGQSEKFNILLEDMDLNDNSKDGITGTSFTDMAVTFTITINSGVLASSSQEYIMITVFHELLHA